MYKPIVLTPERTFAQAQALQWDLFTPQGIERYVRSNPHKGTGAVVVHVLQANGLAFSRDVDLDDTYQTKIDVFLGIFNENSRGSQIYVSFDEDDVGEDVQEHDFVGVVLSREGTYASVHRGDDCVELGPDGNGVWLSAIRLACTGALHADTSLHSVLTSTHDAHTLSVIDDIVRIAASPRAQFGPLRIDDPHFHLKEFLRSIFNPANNLKSYRKELKDALLKLYQTDVSETRKLVQQVNMSTQTVSKEEKEAGIRLVYEDHLPIQQFLINEINQIDGATLLANVTVGKFREFNAFYALKFPLVG